MPTSNEPLDAQWLNAMDESVRDLATTTLGFDQASVEDTNQQAEGNRCGAYLALVGGNRSYQLGVLSSALGCDELGRALFGLAPEEELPPGDVSDAMCEIVNVIAGGVKRRLAGSVPLSLGLPLFVNGSVAASEETRVWVGTLQLGSVSGQLVLMTRPVSQENARG